MMSKPPGSAQPPEISMNLAPPADDAALRETNRRFYDPLWSKSRLIHPERFNTWPMVQTLLPSSQRALEVAPGLRPRRPLARTAFVDFSAPAIGKLRAQGAHAVRGVLTALPFRTASFDLVCALDIIEHVDDEDAALSELTRVATDGAQFLLSVPLHPARWTAFDEFVGHRRRYEPARLLAKLAQYGLELDRSAAYGMQPKSSRLLDLGMWFLEHRRSRAMWWYNNVFMPLEVRFQKPLVFGAGLIDTDRVDEILFVCRKRGR
jgi:SAM-dependent methyltransferase